MFNRLINYFLKKRVYPSECNSNKFQQLPFSFLGEGANVSGPFLVKNHKYISIGKGFNALYNLRLEAWDEFAGDNFSPEIIIGNNVIFNSDVHIGCIDRVEIGDGSLLASRIFICDCSHGYITSEALLLPPAKRPLVSKGPVIIGKNVWIGEGVSILSGVSIGDNCIIGANAVVTKSLPANAVAGGIPCKVLKQL
jgi:acetyltransferase-like isoleucine patch superfamily enzyme